MPTSTSWVEPEVFLTHTNVTVYRTYKDHDVSQGTNAYWFTCDSSSDDHSFDVRELNTPSSSTLNSSPPYLRSDLNPEFDSATPEQRERWASEWRDWRNGGEEAAIRKVLQEAIDAGLLSNEPYL